MGKRHGVWALVAVVLVAALAGGGLLGWQRMQRSADDAVQAAAERVATAISAGDVSGLAFAGTDSQSAQTAYAAAVKSLGSAPTTAKVLKVARDGDQATGQISVTRMLPGDVKWTYELPLRLAKGETWQVPKDQPLVHPQLPAGQVLKLRRTSTPRANVLGAAGKPIVAPGTVVDVGVQPGRIKGTPAALAAQLAKLLKIDAAPLTKAIEAAAPTAFVDVITLRGTDYDSVRSQLQPIPGVIFRKRDQPLTPTREFARALLGTVGPVTAEIVAQGKGRYVTGDVAGVSGLQRQYDEQLAGTPGLSVEIATTSTEDSSEPAAKPLFQRDAVPGKPLRLTLDVKVQMAADAALQGLSQPSALVAVDVRTGAVLAVANSPATGLNRAMVGKYPPGSTFKVVSTLALLEKGLKATDSVACPPTATVGGRTFKNYESEKLGSVPFRTDFAMSCNTAFVGLSARLGDDALRTTAQRLGMGADWQLGTNAFSGSVPATTSDVDRAAATFGQGRIEVSPLAVTVATGSVARGAYLPPSLVVSDGAPAPAAQPLPAGPIGVLQSLMRDVVTSGTATVLKSVAGERVHAKTGTAEFGTDSPPKTRAWITGWQGNIAFTAFVEEGKSGGTVAGPVAATFLAALNR